MANVTIQLAPASAKAVVDGTDTAAGTITVERAIAEQLWIATGNVLRGPSGGKKKGGGKSGPVRKR
jgi:hypothetical protein